jgi:hypothetical protein
MTGFGTGMLGTFSFLGGWISMFGEKITSVFLLGKMQEYSQLI